MNARILAATALIFAAGVPAASAESIGVLIRFGYSDRQPSDWDGSLSVATGKVTSLEGWRFEDTDAVTGESAWKARTRPLSVRRTRGNNPQKLGARRQQQAQQSGEAMADNGVVAQLTGVSANTLVSVKTAHGDFSFRLSELAIGRPLGELDGAASVERVAATQALTTPDNRDHDFPAIASDGNGGTWVAWTSFTPGLDRAQRARGLKEEMKEFDELARPTGGDQVWLRHRKAGDETWGEPLAVTPGRGDIMRCAVAVDGRNRVWVFYSDRRGDCFSIYARSYDGQKLGEEMNFTDGRHNHLSPVAVTDSEGRVWVAWQGADTTSFRIYASRQETAGFTKPFVVNEGMKRNSWSPAIAATKSDGGRIAIVWDGYEKGDYDVFVREFGTDGKTDAARPVANSPDYESRASLAYDAAGRLWIAWEQSGPKWGKDWGAYDKEDGIGLYKERKIGLRVLDHGVWKEPAQSVTAALPGRISKTGWDSMKWSQPNDPKAANSGGFAGDEKKGQRRKPPGGAKAEAGRRKGEEAETQGLQVFNNCARVAADNDGRIWLLCRTRQGQFHTPIGSTWSDYAAYYEGDKWTGAMLMPHTDNLLFNFPAITAAAHGIRLAHSSDHRQDKLTVWKKNRITGPGSGNAALGASVDPFVNDVYVSEISLQGNAKPPVLVDVKSPPDPGAKPADHTAGELADVKAIRGYRMKLNGTELRILRGEFHRHTEISGDGGGDGPLEDMWRYALDVARMDWIGNGDHDNGGGREYPWWLTQKTTDAYHLPGHFDPMFTYERSVSYPEGHRNVIFVQRGVRTLPRLPISDAFDPKPAPDTQMLYKYLHRFNGVCASHTSATSMGTDWRDNDPAVEPFVEIYQGARQNYERPGAPRCPSKEDSIGGWEPKGFVNLALLKGYRLAFESSSDHGSTHISYACVYAKENSRQAIFDGIKMRHTYAATDNIIADVRAKNGDKEQMMGEEFTTRETPNLVVKLTGTQPFAKVTIIKDDVEVESMTPGTKDVSFTWKDPNPQPGKTSYYYVRGEQTDTELVWASPMWMKYEP